MLVRADDKETRLRTQFKDFPSGAQGIGGANGSSGIVHGNAGQVGANGGDAGPRTGTLIVIGDSEVWNIIGGTGGNGGNGGNGGTGVPFIGAGGNGGRGGDGGQGTSFILSIGERSVVSCTAGSGGDGGTGGTAGGPGAATAGDGGNGGDGGFIRFAAGAGCCLRLLGGDGGKGGEGGCPSSSSSSVPGSGGRGAKGGNVTGHFFSGVVEDSTYPVAPCLIATSGAGGSGGSRGSTRQVGPPTHGGDGGDGGDIAIGGSNATGNVTLTSTPKKGGMKGLEPAGLPGKASQNGKDGKVTIDNDSSACSRFPDFVGLSTSPAEDRADPLEIGMQQGETKHPTAENERGIPVSG